MESSTYTSSGSGANASMGATGSPSGLPDVNQIKQQAGQMAGQFVDQARGQVSQQLDSQKARAADSLGSVARALRSTSEHLRTQQQEPIAGATEQAAQVVENVAGYLRDARIEDLAAGGEDFARRQPALFLGGAFALGFMAVRFLKSSGSSMESGGYGQESGSRSSYGAQYGSGASMSSGGSTLPTAYDRAAEHTSLPASTGASMAGESTGAGMGTLGSASRAEAPMSPTTPTTFEAASAAPRTGMTSSAMGDAYDMEDVDQMSGARMGGSGSSGSSGSSSSIGE